MNSGVPEIPIVRAILALFMVIVAILSWMLAGSTLLAETVNGLQPDMAVVWFSMPFGAGYILLAWAIHRQYSWGLLLALFLLCGVLAAGIADLERPGLMALDATLTMLMAAISSMAAIVVLSFPALDRLAHGRGDTGDGPGAG